MPHGNADKLLDRLVVLKRSHLAAIASLLLLALADIVYILFADRRCQYAAVLLLVLILMLFAAIIYILLYALQDPDERDMQVLRRNLYEAVSSKQDIPAELRDKLLRILARKKGIPTRISAQKDVKLNALVARIIDGTYDSAQEINDMLREFGFTVPQHAYILTLFHTLDIPTEAFNLDLENNLRKYGYPIPLAAFFRTIIGELYAPEFSCLICETHGIFKCIVIADKEMPHEEMLRKIRICSERIVAIFQNYLSITMVGAISLPREDFTALRSSNEELERLMSYRSFVRNANSVLSYDVLNTAERNVHAYVVGQQKNQEMIDLLMASQYDAALELYRQVAEKCSSSEDGSYLLSQHLLSELTYVSVFAVMQASGVDIQDLYQKLLAAKSAGEYQDIFETMLTRLKAAACKKDEATPWPLRMKQYIEAHYADPDLSVATVSAAFHYNPIYATRIYRQETGTNISEEIQNCRLEHSRKLLGTGLTVKEIAEACGFSSAAAMNRLYTKVYGTTPGKLNIKT